MNKKLLPLIFFILFLGVNFIFNHQFFKEVLFPDFGQTIIDDGLMTEFLTETSYQNILKGKNPFIINKSILYPFETNFSLNDHAITNLPFLLVLRPFFNIHQATLIIVLINLFLSSIFMYLLIKKLRVSRLLALIASLIFTYTPFISHRMLGHYTYTLLYLFPLQMLMILNFFQAKQKKTKTYLSLGLGFILAFTFLANFYYFLSSLLAIFIGLIWFIFWQRKTLVRLIKTHFLYLPFSFLSFILLLFPWLISAIPLIVSGGLHKTPGFGGAITLSADAVNFFTPSEYNPFYYWLFSKLLNKPLVPARYVSFFFHGWQSFAYPGIIIIAIYLYLLFFRKKLPKKIYQQIKPYFFISIFFILLIMGPFLKIANRWFISLEGINVYFPLPFILLQAIPGLSSVRAPTRFMAMFIFLATIVAATIINYQISKVPRKKRLIIVGLFLLIFFFDQFYTVPSRPPINIPLKAYEYIKNDPEVTTVLEIPFAIRDGLQYLGFVHGISIMRGALIHQKPVIGGYLARVNPAIFNYYKNLPFISHILKITDKGNYRLYKESPAEPVVTSFEADLNTLEEEISFLDIKYVLLRTDEKYSQLIKELLIQLGFILKMEDVGFQLFEKSLTTQEFSQIAFGSANDYLFTAKNFSVSEDDFRWTINNSAQVFVKTDGNKNQLAFAAASFYQPQKVKIYINKTYLATKQISTEKNNYTINNISDYLKPGINTIDFKFSQSFKPAEVFENNNDQRNLAIKFYNLNLK
ncbi:hypothetical protein KKD62_02145 [Patescibacteria group bacterium]|nr:hypothetical protein [Patescibacteria group bacterium]